MKWARVTGLYLGAIAFALSALAQTSQPEAVRPSGVATQYPKASAVEPAEATPNAKERATKPPRLRPRNVRPAPAAEVDLQPRTSGGVPNTGAASVIVVDAHSGQTLYEKNADQFRAAASTQKLLTALIVAEHGFLDRRLTVETIDTMAEPVKLNIRAGDSYQRIDLLRALLVKSPNDVARCLARDNAGSIEAFAAVMNERARELGATHSHFVNPNGLPVPGQYSTARDLSLIARAAYANPTIRSIVCLPQLVFRFANGRTRELENTNKVLTRLPYCNGMKTGYTEAAGHCLIASGARPGRDVIVVLLGDSKAGVWRDASALLSWSLWM